MLPLAVASLAVAIVAVAALALRGRSPEPAAPPPTFQRITFRRGALNTARFAPDGRIVYSAAWEGSPRQMFVAGSNPGDALALDVRDARLVGVSSMGEISFLRAGTLARAALAGGPAKEMLTEVVAADWSEDGKDLVVVRSGANGHKLEFPAGSVVFETSSRLLAVRLSPDRRLVAVSEHPILGDDRGRVLIVDRAGKTVAKSVEFASLNGIAWPPGGREVFFTASEVGADNSLRALGVDGHARQVLDSTGRLVVHDVAPDGRVLLERTTLRTEMMHRRAADKEDRELSWLDYSGAVALSSDGKTVLFYESGEGGGAEYATYLRGFDGSPPVRVGSGRALDLSPDGSLVLTVDIRDPSAIDVTPTGPGQARKLRIPSLVAHEDGGFLADGRRVFVMGRQDSGVRSTWLTDLDGSSPRQLPLPPGRFLAQDTFSADGSRFIADCPDGKYPCLYDTERGDPKVIPGTERGWMGVAIDLRGRLYFRDRTPWRVEKLYRVENGRAIVLGELAPRDRAGAAGMLDVAVSADGEAWVYTFLRRLSELHVVSGLH
jgi:Tol biopolymer transport system component